MPRTRNAGERAPAPRCVCMARAAAERRPVVQNCRVEASLRELSRLTRDGFRAQWGTVSREISAATLAARGGVKVAYQGAPDHPCETNADQTTSIKTNQAGLREKYPQ